MKIVKCPECKKNMHETERCFYCGNMAGFKVIEKSSIHEKVVTDYEEVEKLLKKRKYEEAIEVSDRVVEWMPKFSGIFWLRFLAKNHCSCAAELIERGADCEESGDFYNALSYSKGAEHSCYSEIRNMINEAKEKLKEEIRKHERKEKKETDILKTASSMKNELRVRKDKLFSLWNDLEKMEEQLYILEKDCALLAKEHSDMLGSMSQEAECMKSQVYRLAECTYEDFHKYQVILGGILQQSEQTKAMVENIRKQHPWIIEFQNLEKKRDQKIQVIRCEITSLKNYMSELQKVINQVEQIEKVHKDILHSVDRYEFTKARALLGESYFKQILHEVGLRG